jgi:hypothetical protein
MPTFDAIYKKRLQLQWPDQAGMKQAYKVLFTREGGCQRHLSRSLVFFKFSAMRARCTGGGPLVIGSRRC